MTSENIAKIFCQFRDLNPSPKTELQYTTPFELLIAVMLSAQATDVSVNKVTPKLFTVANTPKKMLALGEQGVRSIIKSIGLYNTKAKNVIKTCEILVTQYQSQIPRDRDALEFLPGVGRKTANIILNTLYGESTLAVDTHIFRVSRRIGLSSGNNPRAVERDLEQVIPAEFLRDAHHWLVLHGRYICVARKPKCPICPIKDLCEFPDKTNV